MRHLITAPRRISINLLSIALATILSPALAFGQVSSSFDSGWGGWTATSGEVTWQGAGGNTGGYLDFQDAQSGGTWVVAPAAFHGDWSPYVTFSWDHISWGDFGPSSFQPQVTIYGQGGNYATWWSDSMVSPTEGWQTFSVSLIDPDFTHMSVHGDWNTIMQDVTDVKILIDGAAGISGDNEGVDNVMLMVPEPTALSLLALGVSALVCLLPFRRRST